MKDNTKNVPPEPTLAERRKRLAEALGFLLARAWLRDHRQPAVPATEDPSKNNRPEHPP